MIRPLTLVSALLAAGSGLYLYQTKHQAQLLDREIGRVRAATEAKLTRAGTLQAEYWLLNDPERLEELAAQYLPDLKPTLPLQWTSLSELDKRLPPVGAPTDAPAPLEADPAPTAHDDPPAEPHPAPVAAAAHPASVAVARAMPHPIALAVRPAPAAAPAPVPAPPQFLAARPPAPPQAQVAHGQGAPMLVATQLPPPRPLRAPVPAPGAFVSQSAPVYIAATHPNGYATPSTTAEALTRVPPGGTLTPPVPVVASALGMARTMAAAAPGAANLYPASSTR
jgi:hypothetical protein